MCVLSQQHEEGAAATDFRYAPACLMMIPTRDESMSYPFPVNKVRRSPPIAHGPPGAYKSLAFSSHAPNASFVFIPIIISSFPLRYRSPTRPPTIIYQVAPRENSRSQSYRTTDPPLLRTRTRRVIERVILPTHHGFLPCHHEQAGIEDIGA